jgi:hypothetical protein
MKYKPAVEVIPQSNRAEINNKILFLIENGTAEKYGISKSDVFNSYTGVGGLHGLNRSDYNNYSEYSKDKKSVDNGQYFTTPVIADFLMKCVSPGEHDIIMDLTGGAGVFINSCPAEQNFYMNEIDINAVKVSRFLYPDAQIKHGDIREYYPEAKADIIIGNPPFNINWYYGNNKYVSQLFYCVKAAELLNPGGLLGLVTPCSFLADEFSDSGMIKIVERYFSFICQFDIPANSFQAMGVANFPVKIMFFRKNSEHIVINRYNTAKLKLSSFTDEQAAWVHSHYIENVMAEKKKLKSKFHFELISGDDKIETDKFNYKVKLFLYQIMVHPKSSPKYAACLAYIERYKTQVQPKGMKYEEWCKIRITPAKVIAYLRKALTSQNKPPEQDIIRLVKTKNSLKLKGYSHKTRASLKASQDITSISIHDAVAMNAYPFSDDTYLKLIHRKRQAYQHQTQEFDEMEPDAEIVKFLRNIVIYDKLNEGIMRLSPVQINDTAKILSKPYGFLQWEQGSGKTISGIAQYFYRRQHNNIFCTFVVSPAISIKNNWDVVLKYYGIDYIMIKKPKDLKRIRRGQMVLITLNMLCNYERYIKRFVKIHNKKIFLLYDESDTATNMSSKRSKAVKNCFRRVKYKTLMTGTSTRNNINEFFSQLELLYNNSINMLCECEWTYYRDRKEQDNLTTCNNPDARKPFPAYKAGFSLFQECFLPEKITVFGAGQNTQDVYNADKLKRLLNYTIITRTFEEVTGKKIYAIQQETCVMSEAEKVVYKTAIEKFYLLEYLFSSTGNSRKDAMLRVLNQLKMLLRICAAPQTIREYESAQLPPKFEKVLSIIEEAGNERIALGARHVNVVNAYADAIKERFPDRKLFVVIGSKVTLEKRRAVIRELEETENGILLSTQESLSCAINCDCVDTCIIPELYWNNAAMSQYYFRFIRYNSTRSKKVIFVTYETSIESNLLQMIMVKEKLNLFMKNQELDDDEIYDKFGVNFDILQMLMTKERDHEGNLRIRWGQQEIVS